MLKLKDFTMENTTVHAQALVVTLTEGPDTGCRPSIPRVKDLIRDLDTRATILLVVVWVCVALILALYIDQIVFFVRNFERTVLGRGRLSLYVLTLAPVYAVAALLGVMVPRAGVLVDLVSDAYLPTAVFSLHLLIQDYLGGRTAMQTCSVTTLTLQTPPCCCCCGCLPKIRLSKGSYRFVMGVVYQGTIVRPLIAFVAAVLLMDGEYTPGKVAADEAYIYLTVLGTLSSLLSIWGLLILQTSYKSQLAQFSVSHKFLYVQGVLLGTTVGNLVIGGLVSAHVITCNRLLPSASRAQTVYHVYVIFLMLVISVWGRFAFRRLSDAPSGDHTANQGEVTSPPLGEASLTSSNEQSGDGDQGLTPVIA